jgi:hypothetical protein
VFSACEFVLVIERFLDCVMGLLWGAHCMFVWVGICLYDLRICLDLFDLCIESLSLYVDARTHIALVPRVPGVAVRLRVALDRCAAALFHVALVACDHIRGRVCDCCPFCDRDCLDSVHLGMLVSACLVTDASYALGPEMDSG